MRQYEVGVFHVGMGGMHSNSTHQLLVSSSQWGTGCTFDSSWRQQLQSTSQLGTLSRSVVC